MHAAVLTAHQGFVPSAKKASLLTGNRKNALNYVQQQTLMLKLGQAVKEDPREKKEKRNEKVSSVNLITC